MAITMAATGEDLDPEETGVNPVPAVAGITIQIVLANHTGTDASEIEVKLPIPDHTHVTDSWVGQPGVHAGSQSGDSMVWRGLAVKNGDRLGPIAYRAVPDADADGARIFDHATVVPEVSWTRPTARSAGGALGGLRLNGLWGEGSLRRTVLPSGLTVFTRERPDSTTVSIRLAARAGSRDENATTRGGSHWLEHGFFLGTSHRQNLDTELDAVGGESDASTGWESTNYWYLVPAENFGLALDLLADQMLYSTFPQTEVDRERQVVGEELKRRNDNPSTHAFDEFINHVFVVSPLRQHPSGTIQSVLSIPIETILAYKNQRYVSGNMAIAVSGNIRHDDAVTRIEQEFADLRQGPRSVRPPVAEPVQTDPRIVTVGNGDRVAEIRLGWPAPGDDAEAEAAAMTVLNDILGETGRRLSEEIRDRRALATSVDSDYLDFSDAGALMISATTQPVHADEVIQLILDQIRRVRAGDVSDSDVAASLRAIAGRRALEDESNEQQTSRADVEVSGNLDSWEEYMAKLRSVTAADVIRVANKWLDPQNYTLVVVRA
ncbi:MAG TPA: pitrilysin family protein [Chloroflexota bacterium]|nr:pitrilysin family protein [Chloroflexota bacterium]